MLTSLPEASETEKHPSKCRENQQQKQPSSWYQFKNSLPCMQMEGSRAHDPSKNVYRKLGSCGSICMFRDVVYGNTRVDHRVDISSESSSSSSLGHEARLLMKRSNGSGSTSSSSSRSFSSLVRSNGSSTSTHARSSSNSKGMQFRKLSGCYECQTVVDPSRYPLPRSRICACSQCGEVFPKIESLEQHQAIRHAVSELGPEDSSRNIVEIIFKSSWLKKNNPSCNIERILKVHNTRSKIQSFEDCRAAVKIRANNNAKKNPRCAADGNELLRFHCTSLTCSLGARGSSSLCGSTPSCAVCTIIRHGFEGNKSGGVRTTASSGRAHDDCLGLTDRRRAMLVCRVIAGRVKRAAGNDAVAEEDAGPSTSGTYDSVAGCAGMYSNLEELYVFNPRAILPCFVVIYNYEALES